MSARCVRCALWIACALLVACEEDGPTVVPVPSIDAGEGGVSSPGSDAGMREAGGSEGMPGDCRTSVGRDYDYDGYQRGWGYAEDCDDCDPARGPDAIDVPHNGVDEDCSGADALEPQASCDGELARDDTSAEEAARALGLCRDGSTNTPRRWGLLEARWLRLSGAEALEDARQVWLPERFGGITAREGKRLLVLSTGVARDVSDEGIEDGYTPMCDPLGSTVDGVLGFRGGVAPPEGFPKESSRCEDQSISRDVPAFNDVGLRITVRTPMNARAIAFDSMFLTHEYPDYVCSRFNDFFVVLMEGAPRAYESGNVLVDANEDPIGVNSGLLAVCRRSNRADSKIACERGPGELFGTGFDVDEATCGQTMERDVGGASTGWLHTEVKVEPGKQVTLHFLLWDSADPLLDSTVLLDNFQFLTTEPATMATTPITSG